MSQPKNPCNSCRIGKMVGSSRVVVMRDSSQVGKMWDSSRIGEMCNQSTARDFKDYPTIKILVGDGDFEIIRK